MPDCEEVVVGEYIDRCMIGIPALWWDFLNTKFNTQGKLTNIQIFYKGHWKHVQPG